MSNMLEESLHQHDQSGDDDCYDSAHHIFALSGESFPFQAKTIDDRQGGGRIDKDEPSGVYVVEFGLSGDGR